MVKKFSVLLLVVLSPVMLLAQHLEVGLNLGLANYWGDLAPEIVRKETHMTSGVYARINLSSTFAFTAAINNATISGDDKNFDYNAIRNIRVKTPLTEYTGVIEFNFLKFGVDVLDKKFSPYVFWGMGFVKYDPKAIVGNSTVDLRNIQTENKGYSSSAVCMPFGMGFKWQFHRHFAAEANLNFRRVFSDYLDDVSSLYPDNATTATRKGPMGAFVTDPSSAVNNSKPLFAQNKRRGNSDYTDWYVTSTVSISYRFYKRSKCRRFY